MDNQMMVETAEQSPSSIAAGVAAGTPYFQVAEPFSREEFLLRYQQVALFAKLLFAPFGLHYQTAELLNEKQFLETYTQIYQQLEDVMSKCIFRHFGYADDRIIATMHKFIGQQNDAGIIKEIKPATDSLVSMALPAQVVDFCFDQVNFQELFSAQTSEQVLQRIVNAISSLHQHVDTKMEIDERVQRVLGIEISKRIASPIIEFHELSSKQGGKAADIIQQLTESLTIVVHKQIKRHLDATMEEEVVILPETTNISLSYDQYISLIEQFAHRIHLQSSTDNSTEAKEVDIEQLQSGSAFREVNKFMHPTISFIQQLCEKIKTHEDDPDADPTFPIEMAEKSLHFTFAALQKLENAKASANAGDAATAMEDLSVDLLDVFEVEGSGEVMADVVLPVFLHTQLLVERSKFHAEIGNLNGALADVMMAIALDGKCSQAYAMRSQLLLASLQSYEPLEAIDLQDIAEETSEYLQQLFPSDVVENVGIEEQDLVMHQAAEDALLAFLLGGSSDIASAAAAEEAARETCRKFAKATYAARRKAKQEEIESGNYQATFPRPWLVSAYFSGYELLSTALQVFGESSVEPSEVATMSSSDTGAIEEIDEGDYEEKKQSLIAPPDHLLDETTQKNGSQEVTKVVRELDPQAYNLLLQLVDELEQCSEKPNVDAVVGLDAKDKEIAPDEVVMYRVFPTETADDLLEFDSTNSLPRLRENNTWHLVTCGHEEAKYITGDEREEKKKQKKLKIVDLQPTAEPVPSLFDVSKAADSFAQSLEGILSHSLLDEVEHCIHLTKAIALLNQHAEMLAVEMNADGSIKKFSLEVPDFAYSMLSAATHENSSAKFSFGRRNSQQDEEDEYHSQHHQKFNPEDFYKAHFGGGFGQFGFEHGEENDEWEDAEDSEDDENVDKNNHPKKKVVQEDDEDVWEDCDDDEEEEEEDDDDEEEEKVEAAVQPIVDVDDLPVLRDESHIVVSNVDELDIEHHHDVSSKVNETTPYKQDVDQESLSMETVLQDLRDLDFNSELADNDEEAKDEAIHQILPVADPVDEDEMERKLLAQFDTTIIKLDHQEGEDDLNCEVHEVEREAPKISKKVRARLLNILGSLVYLCGDATGALKCFEASLHFDPSLLDSKVKLGSLLIDMDEQEKASLLLKQCMSEHSEHPVVYLHYAELAINQNDFAQAVQNLRKANRYAAMGWTPEMPKLSAKDSRNNSDWMMGFEQRKLASVENVRSNIYALLGVATFRENPNKPEYSMSVLEEGLEQFPNALILLLCAGEVHSQCGDMVKSIKMFRRASLLEAGHPLPWVNAARTYQQLGQLEAANEHVKVALSLDPSIAMTRVDYAQLLRQSERMEEAVETIDIALTLARQVSEIRDVMTARYVTLLQQSLKQKGLYTSPISI